jgi:hypothetical protein
MRDEHERHVLFMVKPNKEFEDQTCVLAVEVAGGLVREQNGRTIAIRPASPRRFIPRNAWTWPSSNFFSRPMASNTRAKVAGVAAAKVAALIDER